MTDDAPRDRLRTYFADHLAGAELALDLIADLRDHAIDPQVRTLMQHLHEEISADRAVLSRMARAVGSGESRWKEAGAWLAGRLTRVRIGLGHGAAEGVPLFEAVEAIALGIQGKIKLWDTLAAAGPDPHLVGRTELAALRALAITQHNEVELLRQRLARELFQGFVIAGAPA